MTVVPAWRLNLDDHFDAVLIMGTLMKTGRAVRSSRNDGSVMRAGGRCSILIALRRNRIPPARRVARLRVADLEIDALDPRITQGTRELRLSPSEHMLLYTLAAMRGTLVSYGGLSSALGNGHEVRANTVARHVATLRRKLGDDAQRPRYIETVHGLGYRLAAPER
jgi:DNA-binding response OmpR family regulator